jgi:PAS domain S-box-containing protein
MQIEERFSPVSNLVASGTKRLFVRSRALPIAVGTVILATTLILWQALLARERAGIAQTIQLEASNAKFEITRQLQERTQALERMAARWGYAGKLPKDRWEADASLYIQHYGGFQAIEWVDSSFYVRWIVPLRGNEAAQNLNLASEARRRTALEAARNQHQVAVTRTINFKQGRRGFQVYAPIFRQEQFGGFIVGVFRTQEFLDTIFNNLDKRVGYKYALTIFDGNEPIYSRYLDNGVNEKQWGQDTTISFNGITWRMRVWPESQLLEENRSPLPTVALITGFLTALLVSLAINLAQITGRRAKKLEAVSQRLEDEIVQRQQVEEALKKHVQMLDLANDTIMIRDLNNAISYWNQGAQRLYGWKKEEVLGKFVHALLQTEFPKPLEEIREILLDRGYWQGELVHIKRDGTRVMVESRWTLQRDERGQPSAILEINNEISDRKQAERRLEAQYTTARVLAESASLSEATPKILQALCDSLEWDLGELWSVNQQGNVLDFVTAWYQPSVKVPEFEAVTRSNTFAPGIGLPGRVWESGESIWIADITQDENCLRAAVTEKAGLHAAFGFPILNSKEVVGVIAFFSREIRQPDRELLEMVTAIGQQIGQFIERQQAEEALEQQRQWLEVTLSSIGDGVIATDTAAIITFMNPVAEALTGWPIQDALGRKIDEVFCIIHEYTRQAAEIPVERALRESVVVELAENTALIARDGKEIPIDDSCASIRDKSGTLQGAVLIFRDITKRKQTAEALKKSEKRYRSVFNTVKDVIFQTDATGVWTFFNPAWTEITGFTLEETIGTNFLDYVHPDDRQLSFERFQPLIARQQEYCRYEIRYLAKDGSFRWMEVFARLTLDSNDAIAGISGTLHDISTRKQAEEEIRNALEKEKELNQLKSRFVNMTSHEFRTPLTTILGSAELLEYYSQKWSEEKKLIHLHRIQSHVKRLTHLLDDILLIGKVDAGRLNFNPEPIDLEQFCRSLVEELQFSAGTQHRLSFVCQGQCTDACMDEKLLRHILDNLLSNAIKYSPTGGTVHFALACHDGEATFQIRDEGIGIPPEDLKRLFETFHRASNVGKIQGTGLGLAIVKKSVDLHGGKISANSEIDVGTTFIVTIPLEKNR